MPDPDLDDLGPQAERGDPGAVDVMVEMAGERGDRSELQRLAPNRSRDAADVLAELDEGSPESDGP